VSAIYHWLQSTLWYVHFKLSFDWSIRKILCFNWSIKYFKVFLTSSGSQPLCLAEFSEDFPNSHRYPIWDSYRTVMVPYSIVMYSNMVPYRRVMLPFRSYRAPGSFFHRLWIGIFLWKFVTKFQVTIILLSLLLLNVNLPNFSSKFRMYRYGFYILDSCLYFKLSFLFFRSPGGVVKSPNIPCSMVYICVCARPSNIPNGINRIYHSFAVRQ
jgi:hypothetical protein